MFSVGIHVLANIHVLLGLSHIEGRAAAQQLAKLAGKLVAFVG